MPISVGDDVRPSSLLRHIHAFVRVIGFHAVLIIAMFLEQGQPPIIPMLFQLSLANLGERGRSQYPSSGRPGLVSRNRTVLCGLRDDILQ
jgi:hypothetical protein